MSCEIGTVTIRDAVTGQKDVCLTWVSLGAIASSVLKLMSQTIF